MFLSIALPWSISVLFKALMISSFILWTSITVKDFAKKKVY